MSRHIRQLFNPSLVESSFLSWAQQGYASELVGWQKSSFSGYGLSSLGKIPSGMELVKIPSQLWKPFSAEYNSMAISQGNPALYNSLIAISSRLMPNFPSQANALVQSACLALKIMTDASSPQSLPYIGLLRESSYPKATNSLPHPLLMDSNKYLDPYLGKTTCCKDIIHRRNMYTFIANSLFPAQTSSGGSADPAMVDLFKWSIGKYVLSSEATI